MSLFTYDDVVKEGYVKLKKLLFVGLWKKYWVCLRKSSSLGPSRLEFIKCKKGKLEESVDSVHLCIEIGQIEHIDSTSEDTNMILLTSLGNSKYFLGFDSNNEKEGWRSALAVYLLDAQRTPNNIFHVFVLNNPALPFYGECLLNILERSIHLTEAGNPDSVLMVWPLVSLRRFHGDEHKFIFETGRACKTGEGLFVFNTKNSEMIVNMIRQASSDLVLGRPSSLGISRPPLPPIPSEPPVPSRKARSKSIASPGAPPRREFNP